MDFGDGWGGTDTALLISALAGVYADVQTTKDAIKRGAYEANPLIGKNPSGQDLDKVGLLGAGLVGSAAYFSDPKDRKEILGALAGLRLAIANQNAHTDSRTKRSGMEGLKQPLLGAALGALAGHLMDDSDNVKIKPEQGGISILFNKRF